MKRSLPPSAYVVIGTMLFGLFFGAGNLIFPLFLGQLSGSAVWIAITGFLMSGIGLPFLGVLAVGYSNAGGLQNLAARVHPVYGVVFTLVLYLTIGPIFALPRTGTASYEIGFSNFLSSEQQTTGLAIYSLIYFCCALYFALSPAKVILWVGKILTPIFLLFIILIVLFSIIAPMGYLNAPLNHYASTPFAEGFLEGYNTMDALASLAFGIIVVNAIKHYGITEPIEVVKTTAKAGLVGMLLMGAIYVAIAYVGASSVNSIGLLDNGGQILAKVVHYYIGDYGSFFLAILIYLTCITTAIGLISACASCFHDYLPIISYKTFAVIVTLLAGWVANVGLTNIIMFAIPVLMLIYPLTISLILLIFLSKYFHDRQIVYVVTTIFTACASSIEALRSALDIFTIKNPIVLVRFLLDTYCYLPLSSIGMGWLTAMVTGILIGWLLTKMIQKHV